MIRPLIITTLLCLCYALASPYLGNAQNTTLPTRPNAYDTDSLKSGEWIYYYQANWNLATAGDSIAYYRLITYEKGKPTGPFGDYYANGKPQMLGELLQENPERYNNSLVYYGETGVVQNYEYYQKGMLHHAKSLSGFEELFYTFKDSVDQDNTDYATTLNNLGVWYYRMGQYAKAEPLHRQALAIRKKHLGPRHAAYVRSLSNSALVYEAMGQFTHAEHLYREALEIWQNTRDTNHPTYAVALNNLASLYRETGNYAKAEPLYRQATEIRKNTLGTQHPDYATSLSNLAILYKTMGRYTQAEALYRQAIATHKAAKRTKHPKYATALNNLASLYMATGDYIQAEALYNQAVEIRKNILGTQHPTYAASLNNLAFLYFSTNRFEQADTLYQRALAIEKEALGTQHVRYAQSLNRLAFLYYSMGRHQQAENLYLQALDIWKRGMGTEHPFYTTLLFRLGALYYHTQGLKQAIPLLEESLTQYQARLTVAFDYLGEHERQAYYNKIGNMFERYIGLVFLEQKHYATGVEQACNLQLQQKALLLGTSNRIKQRILESGDRKLIALYDEVQALKQQIGRQYASGQNINPMDSLIQLLHAKELELTAQSTYYKQAQTPATWQAVQQQLGKHEALVELVRYREFDYQHSGYTNQVHYGAFIITAKSKTPLLVQFPDGNYLEKEGITFYQNAIRYQLEDMYSYQSFWEPLKQALKKVDKVYFSPDGVFHQLNMETLKNPETDEYLNQEIDLQVITTGRELLAKPREPLPNQLALLLGNPAFNRRQADPGVAKSFHNTTASKPTAEQEHPSKGKSGPFKRLPALPGTEQEVKELQALFAQSGWRQQTLLGPEAREEALKDMLKPKVLHIATHGYFQETNSQELSYANDPLFHAGLLLSGASETLSRQEDLKSNTQQGKEDGILTAFEAKNLNIDNTDLVVLSACETGLGEIHNGEGVYGLQRALKVAGARSILMSLWKVNDQTTQELMVSFYRYWLGGMPKRQALHQAQLDLKAKYPHPYYWGAFVLIGE